MKIVQIGCAGHAGYAHVSMVKHGYNMAALSCGGHGLQAEGTENALLSLQKRGFSPKLYSDYREMLEVEKPDIAIVNPFFNEIGETALYALRQGVSVFCEKPVATDNETLRAIRDELTHTDAVFAGMFGSRYLAPFITAKKALREGKVGVIRMMDSRKSYRLGMRPAFYSSRETYCGILPWVAIHAIDWMAWLSGEEYLHVNAYHSALCNGGNGDMDITSCAQFMMTNQVIATVTADMYRPGSAPSHGDDRVRIVGTEGILEVAQDKVTLISDREGGEIELTQEPKGDIFDDFLARMRGEENDLSAESALAASYWALEADRAACRFEG